MADKLDAEHSTVAPQYTVAPTTVAYTGTAARNGSDLAVGKYLVTCTTDAYYLQGDSTVTATTSSHYLPADTPRELYVDASGNARISFIQRASNGTAFISPMQVA